jgi:6,7-dimethyl-8-ribityllumazine synthase
MPRRGVHEASAGVLGNVIAGKKRHSEVIATQTFERMIALQAR